MVPFIVQWLLVALTVSASPTDFDVRRRATIKHISSQAAIGNIQASFISNTPLDAPQLSAVNSTSFDWWYFDVVSTDLKRSLVIVFYTALPSAFPFLPTSSTVTTVGVYATYPNGTITGGYLDATEAVITTDGQGASGDFVGSGAKFQGDPNLSSYSISINAASRGIIGTFNLTSTAPAHYPCGGLTSTGLPQTSQIGPHIGWSNAIPDAAGTADITIFGSRLQFSGVAYHDKNWSDQAFQNNVASWYWGHARLGPYSLVWFSYIPLGGTEKVSSYVARDGKIISSRCAANSVVVRPTGTNNQYPPSVFSGSPDGFTVDFNLADGRVFNVNVTVSNVIANAAPVYTRWTGNLTGKFDGGRTITRGEAILEQFVLVG